MMLLNLHLIRIMSVTTTLLSTSIDNHQDAIIVDNICTFFLPHDLVFYSCTFIVPSYTFRQ